MTAPLLIVAHPGHELMVYGWLEQSRPRVSIITDGSGRAGTPRVASSLRILELAGAAAGSTVGVVSDREFYDAVLGGRMELFHRIVDSLTAEILERRPPYLAGDAREGFNPIHDVCRIMIDSAVRRAAKDGLAVENFEFALFASHDACPPEARPRARSILLSPEALERKLAAARAYPELAAEVEAAMIGSSRHVLAAHADLAAAVDANLAGMNAARLGTECLAPAGSLSHAGDRPFYEVYGERLVQAGTYAQAIRYREHVLPIERSLAAG